MGKMKARVGKQPKRAASWLYRKLPWYAKLLIPLVALVSGLRLLDWMVSLLG